MSSSISGSNPLAYLGVKELNPPEVHIKTRAPIPSDFNGYDIGDIWINRLANTIWSLTSKPLGVSTWTALGGLAGVLNTLTGNDAVIVSNVLGNINVVGGDLGVMTATNGIYVSGNLGFPGMLTVSMRSPYVGNFDFRNVGAANPVAVTVTNIDADPGSYAAFAAYAASPGGDAFITFGAGALYYSLGIDNSVAGDPIKFTTGTSPSGGTELIVMTAAGLITLATPLPVASGGTGRNTLTIHGVLIGNTVAGINATAAGTAGQFLTSGGAGADPVWTTSIFPTTCAVGDVIYGSALNTYTNLAFVNTATRYLANTGGGATIPAWAQVDLTNGVTGILPVTSGGLGVASPTDHAVLVGSGATAVTPIGIGGTGELLVGVAAADPTWTAAGTTGQILTGVTGASPGWIVAGTTGQLLTGVTGANPAFSATSDGNFTFTSATATTNRTLTISNTDNTAVASPAHLQVTVGGTTNTGDPYVNFLITASTTYSFGIDNSDSDKFVISNGATPSAGTRFFNLDSTAVNPYTEFLNVWFVNNRWSNAGGNVGLQAFNDDNTNIISHAYVRAEAGGAAGGDAFFNCSINGAATYSVGIDNTDSDKFKITTGASPSLGTDLFTMTTAGVVTLASPLPVGSGGIGVNTLTSHGILMGNGAGAITAAAELADGQLLIGRGGNFAIPAYLTAGTNVTITQAAGAITINSAFPGTMVWATAGAGIPLVVNRGYICNAGGALSFSLPVASVVGDVIELALDGATSWQVTQGANQQIRLGIQQTTLGGVGALASTAQGDSIRMVCITANLRWVVVSVIGNISIT